MITNIDKSEVKLIENRLSNYKYEQIPKEFLGIVNNNFEIFSYLKSLLEMKKEGIEQINNH
jgi:hypothetical protein